MERDAEPGAHPGSYDDEHERVVNYLCPIATKVSIVSADWIPAAGTAGLNKLFVANTTAQFPNYATYNTASSAIAATFLADGLPVYYVDLVSGTPGLNATTDIATAATVSCNASNSSGHPNSLCGALHMAQTIYAVELARGVVFSAAPGAQNVITASGVVYNLAGTALDITGRTSAISGATLPVGGLTGLYRVTYTAAVSTPASVSSILGGTTGFVLSFFDGADFVSRAITLTESNQSGAVLTIASGNTTNTNQAVVYGSTVVYLIGGFAATYSFGYTSSGTAMAYQIHVRVEQI